MARKMKDSGIEWIGEIPEGWSIARGKHILTLLQRAVFPTDGVITCFRDGEVTLRSNRREDGFTVSLKEIGYQGIEPGDLVVHGMDGFAGSIDISDSRGKSSPVLVVLDSSQDKKYLMYYLRSMAYNNVFLALSTGIRVRSCDLKWNKLADLLYLVPPIVEQHKLVSFLDEKCSEIDAMLSKTRASIEEYKKLKQAVITQAVTKGVRGEREMKDSGVEWIGEIPKDWSKNKLLRIFDIIGSGTTPKSTDDNNYDGNINWLQSGDINGNILKECKNRISFEVFSKYPTLKLYSAPFIIIAMYGASIGNLSISIIDGCVNQACCVLSHANQNFQYMFYCLKSIQPHLIKKAVGGGQPNISQEIIKSLWVPLPPLDEQKEIADYLDAKCTEIDGLIVKKEQLVKELESYKKSLIYEVVTGKREV